jgi:hypothetical protein
MGVTVGDFFAKSQQWMRDKLKGWTEIRLDHERGGVRLSDIQCWAMDNLTGGWQEFFGLWFFENQEDAALFSLTWT